MSGRSIQDIVPPARSKPIRPPPVRDSETPPPQSPHSPQPPMYDNAKKFSFLWVAAGGVLVALVVVGLMSTVFHTANVMVTISEWKSDVSATYTAGGDSQLAYTPVLVQAEATRTVPATGTTQAQDRASGSIVVSNLYSAKPQRLITNTRFESVDGKVYRIHTPITVPGYTTRNGQKIAGTIEATVYADQPGDAYNTDATTFKLPGLKGSNQYDLITAKTKTPLQGGFIGTRATVEKSVRDQAIADIQAELDRTLREKVLVSAPPGSTIFADSIHIRYTEKADVASNQEALVSVTGSASAPAFQGDALTRALATRANIQSDASLIILNQNELQYAEVEGGALDSGGPLSFTLSGTAHLRAEFNDKKYASDIAGKSRTAAEEAQEGYRGLVGAPVVHIRPFWMSTTPKNPERITVEVRGALDK